MTKSDTYSLIFVAMAVFFFLVRSVQRAGSERLPVADTLLYRLSIIAAVLGAVLYVANKAQWHRATEEAASTPVAAPSAPTVAAAPAVAAPSIAARTVAAPTASALVADSVPIFPNNNGTSAMIDVVLGEQPLRMVLDTDAQMCLISEAIAARIIRGGHGVRQEAGRFKMADGTIRILPLLLIKELRIGRHTIRGVPAGVSPTGEML